MDEVNKLKVGISLFPPLIIKTGEKYTGFEIELWEKIAPAISVDFIYQEMPFKELLKKLTIKEIDLAMAGIKRTNEREKIIDFSHFTLRSGLLILISKKSKLNLFSFIKNIITENYRNLLYILILILFFVVVIAHGIWLIERSSGTFDYSYFKGIGESIWWTIVTISAVGYGDFAPQTVAGRLVGIFTIVTGVSIFGLIIAKLASLFTLTTLKYQINSYGDLNGKKVATKSHTVGVDELSKIGAKVVTVDEIEQAFALLENNEIEAVVFDAPVIQHFLQTQDGEKFISVGGVFAPNTYGIAVQSNSRLRELINREILRLVESGEYDMLYKKWFSKF
ncbi:transporter substrate-binding domain-containing protein [Patescibacteria group bacterium]|nr:transporter substrate-binding domain-containing protein [Patescibacteria group bacterium]